MSYIYTHTFLRGAYEYCSRFGNVPEWSGIGISYPEDFPKLMG